MQAAVARCKDIVGGILYASGEARSEDLARTTLRGFLAAVVAQWTSARPGLLVFEDLLAFDVVIAVDRTLAQIVTNVLDNAAEAGASIIQLSASLEERRMVLVVQDDGVGFPPEMLETVGKPYRSTKDRRGAGLGLFLAVNVLRKLGGEVEVRNGSAGGTIVTLSVPLEALALEGWDG